MCIDESLELAVTGILLFAVAAIWIATAAWLSKILAKTFRSPTWRGPIAILIFAALLPLPLIDEIVGGRQFAQLCKENSAIQVNRTTAVGKTVYLSPQPSVEVRGTWVRVVLSPHRFIDVAAGDMVVSYNALNADGGWFIRTLGISEGDAPLTFKGWCKPGDQQTLNTLFRELDLTLIRHSQN